MNAEIASNFTEIFTQETSKQSIMVTCDCAGYVTVIVGNDGEQKRIVIAPPYKPPDGKYKDPRYVLATFFERVALRLKGLP